MKIALDPDGFRLSRLLVLAIACIGLMTAGCGDDDDGTEADRLGVGAQCTSQDDCNPDEGLQCLPDFKGGYCGLSGCTVNEDCPSGSACVAHTDGTNYCFRLCANKAECNRNRSVDNEANCSSNIDFVEASTQGKACVPPSN